MEQSELILRVSVSEVNATGAERLVLFTHLHVGASGPGAGRAELLIMCRDESGCPPPWITKSAIAGDDAARLVTLLRGTGFAERKPRVTPERGQARGGQRVSLEVVLDGRSRTLNLTLAHAGFSGPDAQAVRKVLERLGELAEAAGRPAAREILRSVMVPGTPRPVAGLVPSTEPVSPGWRRR